MEGKPHAVQSYTDPEGKNPFSRWIASLDPQVRQKINIRLRRIEAYGNFGDCEPVGDGVYELRFHFGRGYRVYFGLEDRAVVILLAGGDKRTQTKDIETAIRRWREYQDA